MKAVRVLGALLASGIAVAEASGAGLVDQRLIEAVKQGDHAAIRTTLQRGADVNAAEADGTTALHWAAQNGDVETLRTLIRAKASINARNRYGMTPIWAAAANGYADVVDALLRAGADPETTRSDSGETVLMAAAMAGNVVVIQRLLAFGANPNAVDRVRQQTPLMWAAAERHARAARALVEAGAALEARSSSGLTALLFAVRAGDIDTTTVLLDAGADIRAAAPEDGTGALVLAIINAHWELATRLLERGADPNTPDVRGRPLHVLAFMRRAENHGLSAWLPRRPTGNLDSIDLAKALLASGAKINDRIDWKNPSYLPTHMALNQVQTTTYVGGTPLYIAAKNCDVDFVKFLMANGADPTVPTFQKVTPLLAAAGIGYSMGESPGTPAEALDTIKLLASVGGDLHAAADYGGANAPTGAGWDGAGALHGAVVRGSPDIVNWLIAQGVQIDRKTAKGQTPLDMARGSTVGVNLQVQPELAALIEQAMRAKGLPIPEQQRTIDLNQLDK